MKPLPPNAALLLIDIQQGMDDPRLPPRNNPNAEANIALLLAAWRASGRPVVHVRHHSREAASPLRPELPGAAFKKEALPIDGEPVFTKHVNSAFIGTDLEAKLRERGIEALVVVGVQTNYCVETTARMAGNLGFDTYVVEDAMWTFDKEGPDGTRYTAQQLHDISIVNMHGEFATIAKADEVLSAIS